MSSINAKIITDSIHNRNRITTFELEMPRWILAEFNTHRQLSRNTASSRAIPSATLIKMVEEEPATPVFWGKNQPGMKAHEELEGVQKHAAHAVWIEAAKSAANFVRVLTDKVGINLHKQTANRILENFTMVKTIATATEWENFFFLRNHPDAQPEFQILAGIMQRLYETSEPKVLREDEWHLPYIDTIEGKYYSEGTELSLEDAIKVSVSCCCQVSYRKQDVSLEKAYKIYNMLNLGSKVNPPHASPTEHQAKPIKQTWEIGTTHVSKRGIPWSGNFREWVQYRQLLEQTL